MERISYNLENLFIGDWKLFQEVLQNRKTLFVFDVDGILSNTPKTVLKRFSEKHGIDVKPFEISRWDYLTKVSKENGFSEKDINNAEKDWFNADVLHAAQRYLYVKPIIRKTVNYYGKDNNFVLTARNSSLRTSTIDWFNRELPEIKQKNILMSNEEGEIKLKDSATFKADQLKYLAKKAPWIVFVDDSVDFTKAVIEANIENCLVINIPIGKITPNIVHERQIVIGRYPNEIQAMYPLMDAIERAIGGI